MRAPNNGSEFRRSGALKGGGSYTGSNYHNALYLYDATEGWTAGRGAPPSCDAIGIIISSYSNTQIVFTFGSAYSGYVPLSENDSYNLNLLGASVVGNVAFLP